MQIRKVLVHLDPEDISDSFTAKLLLLASAGVEIALFACCYSRPLRNSYLLDKDAEQAAIASYMKKRENDLAKFAKQLGETGASVSYDLCWDSELADRVVKQAEHHAADLILAPKSNHYLGEYLLNQGDWRLISNTSVPLMLVGAESWSAHPRVAAAVEPFLECNSPAQLDHLILDAAKSMVDLLIGELHVIHSFNAIPQSAIFDEHLTTDYDGLRLKVREQHTEALQQLVDEERVNSAVIHLEEGDVHTKLPEVVANEHIDVVVMGAVDHDFFDRLLTGSSIERVIDQITADLLIVPESQPQESDN